VSTTNKGLQHGPGTNNTTSKERTIDHPSKMSNRQYLLAAGICSGLKSIWLPVPPDGARRPRSVRRSRMVVAPGGAGPTGLDMSLECR
jgi:hypothetical protein